MKAKEYSVMFDGHEKMTKVEIRALITKVFKMFLQEFEELRDSRSSKESSQAVIRGVLNELDNKWKAVANRVPILRPEGFRLLLIDIDKNTASLAGWTVPTENHNSGK